MLAVAGFASAQPTTAERVPPGEAMPAALPVLPHAVDEELLLQVDVNAQGLEDTVLALRMPDGIWYGRNL